jgi:puromycin-sensitive aminopeptidase
VGPKNPYRLKKQVRPSLYELTLEPDLEKFSFRAHETIHFDLLSASHALTLHAADLKIRSASVTGPRPKNLTGRGLIAQRPSRISYDPKFETVTFHFKKKLKAAKDLSLAIEYDGELNDQMHGFYRTSYLVNGKKHWGAATQFEATDARRAFVCIDEPEAKARFKASLIVPKKLTALSNMPIVKTQSLGVKKKVSYGVTPVMSTYLLCFVVAELECVQSKAKDGKPIRIWTTPGKKEQGRFALGVTRHALDYFAKWFGIRYALPKMDQVALPDFASGAMENWGLVTYRETALLVDEKNSSASAKQRVAEVIDHELAHQWFGNLVTMEWWTDLWLNEGFASYMGPKAAADNFPEWELWKQYVAAEFLPALHDDSLKNSHPIEIPVKNPHEIREIFDHITYNKGSAVNRMLEHFLGEPKFRAGLRKYLKKYAYKNAKTEDLWRELEKVSGRPVRKIMAGFTKQTGYPLVTVEEKGGTLEISQKRFIFDGSPDKDGLSWKVPLTYATKTGARSFLLEGKRASVPSPVKDGGWVKFNPGQTGFYRVRYSPELLGRLRAEIQSGRLSDTDALGILDDVSSFIRSGELSAVEVLQMLPDFRSRTDYNIWIVAAGILGSIENLLEIGPATDAFHIVCRGLLERVWESLGWEAGPSDTHSQRLLRASVIGRLGHYGDPRVIEEAKRRFAAGNIAPDLRSAVFGIAAEHGAAADWNKLRSLYKGTDHQEEKVRLLRALTRFRAADVIAAVLEFALSGEVRPQDAYVILAGFGSNGSARGASWAFIQANWKKLTDLYKSGSVGLLGHILEGSTCGFSDEKDEKAVSAFFKAHPVPGTERTRSQTLEVIRSNIAWKKRDLSKLLSWLGDGFLLK